MKSGYPDGRNDVGARYPEQPTQTPTHPLAGPCEKLAEALEKRRGKEETPWF